MEELVKEKDKQLEKFNIYSRCDVRLTFNYCRLVEYVVLL
jgi:hypothetical protein